MRYSLPNVEPSKKMSLSTAVCTTWSRQIRRRDLARAVPEEARRGNIACHLQNAPGLVGADEVIFFCKVFMYNRICIHTSYFESTGGFSKTQNKRIRRKQVASCSLRLFGGAQTSNILKYHAPPPNLILKYRGPNICALCNLEQI